MSHYADCIKDKYNLETYEDEHGFFSFSAGNEFLITEFYIKPESRGPKQIYKKYLEVMYQKARDLGFKELSVSVYMQAKNGLAEATLFLMLREKFKLSHLQNGLIFLKKAV